jgi:hypothetical protein
VKSSSLISQDSYQYPNKISVELEPFEDLNKRYTRALGLLNKAENYIGEGK